MGFLVWCSFGTHLTVVPLQDILRGHQMLIHHPLEGCSSGAGLQSLAGWEASGGTWGSGQVEGGRTKAEGLQPAKQDGRRRALGTYM